MARRPSASAGGRLALEVQIEPRRNSRPICSGCHRKRPGYDRLPRAALRVRAALADRRLLRLRHAPRRLPEVRRDRRGGPVGRRQEPADHDLPLVPGRLGQAALVAGGRRRRSTPPGKRSTARSSIAVDVGPGAPHAERDRGPRRRRDPVAAGAPLPDAGLPDRRRVQAAALGRPGADARTACGGSSACCGEERQRLDPLRVQRHVEAVPEGDGPERLARRSTCWTGSTSCRR